MKVTRVKPEKVFTPIEIRVVLESPTEVRELLSYLDYRINQPKPKFWIYGEELLKAIVKEIA